MFGKASSDGRTLRWESSYLHIKGLALDLEPVGKNLVDLTLRIKGARVVRKRFNVWQIVNVSFQAGFKVMVAGRRYKPQCMLSMWVKAPADHFESQIARNFRKRAFSLRKQTGVVPCQ